MSSLSPLVAPPLSPPGPFKVVVLGDAQTGKSTFVRRNRTGEFTQRYEPTMGVEVSPLFFNTTHGRITLNVWDCAGQEKYMGLQDGYFIKADAALIFFDVCNEESYKNLDKHLQSLLQVCPDIPVLLVGNKVDCIERKVQPKDIVFHRENDLAYSDHSSKSNYNLEKLPLWIMRQLIDKKLNLVEEPTPM